MFRRTGSGAFVSNETRAEYAQGDDGGGHKQPDMSRSQALRKLSS